MEIAIVFGMIGAFLLGAFVREPFSFNKKENDCCGFEKQEFDEENGPKVRQWSELLDYTGERRDKI